MVGKCSFELERSKEWKVSEISDDRAVISYSYGSKSKKDANLSIFCSESDYETLVEEVFTDSDGEKEFMTGAGNSTTTTLKGKNWEGLQTEYFLGTACYTATGKASSQHAFTLDVCDEDTALQGQLPTIRKLLQSLSTDP